MTPANGIEASIVSGEGYPQVFDSNDRVAYVNLSGNEKPFKGIALRFRDIPAGETENFDAVISSFKLLQ